MLTRTQRTLVVAGAVAAVVTAANGSEGAYFSQSWGWVALAFLVPTTLLLILDRVDLPGPLRVAFAVLVGCLGVWIALSIVWSLSAPASAREVERMLVYVAVALAIALVLRRGDGPAVVGGALIGIALVSSYGLATRLLPDRFDTVDDPFNTYRLAEPLGYWNALGILATMGAILAVGIAAHARRAGAAVAAAGLLPVLTMTLYFTFSRGAWAALAIGLAATIVLDPRRLRLVWIGAVVSVPAVVGVAYASRQEALTTQDAPVAAAVREGQRTAALLVALVVSSALVGLGARAVAARARSSRRARRGFDVVLAGAAVAAVALALVAAGGPTRALDRLEERFNAAPVASVDLNDRLFSISGNGRSETLRVAWDAGRARPLVGHGSGSFEYLWYENRPIRLVVRDGHSLYLEAFAEIGLVGLALLVLTLLTLVAGAMRGRRQRLVATGFGAFAAWSAACALDWHWEMVGVSVTALVAGSAGLLASERRGRGRLPNGARLSLLALTTIASALAVWSLVGNQALFAGRDALARESWTQARTDARRAQALLRWSNEPSFVLGDAAAGLGSREAALSAFRAAARKDPEDWIAWLRLANVARGAERREASERVRALNPLAEELPGG